jgi:hypothetical protein
MTKPNGPELRIDRPHSARVYDYLLGGKDNYAADRVAGDAMVALMPSLRPGARANRLFMHRTSRYLAASGIDQFLDVGTGIPTEPNLHQVVQKERPESHIVYVDHDPVVLAHAAALMEGDPRGRTTYVQADARDPRAILASPALHEVIDLRRPVALSLIALLHFVVDDSEAQHIVDTLVAALAPGSYLTISHGTGDIAPEQSARARDSYRASGIPFRLRSLEEMTKLFAGLDLVQPGVTQIHKWRPEPSGEVFADADVSWYGGVARTP